MIIVKELGKGKVDYLCEQCNSVLHNRTKVYTQRINTAVCQECINKNRENNIRIEILQKNNKENGLYILELNKVSEKKARQCKVKCKHCSVEYETRYSTKVFAAYGCRKCTRLKDKGKKIKYKNVGCNDRLYSIFSNMMNRCTNPKYMHYKNYGGKGVTICDEWLKDRGKFFDWALTNGYSDELEIDKDILCDKLNISPSIYSPDTCMWITHKENMQNQTHLKSQNTTGYRGVTLTPNKKKYRARVSLDGTEVYAEVFDTAIEAAQAFDEYCNKHYLTRTRNFS